MARQQKKDSFIEDSFVPDSQTDSFVEDSFTPDAPTPVEPIRSSAPPTGDIANRPDATIFHFPEKHPLFQRRRDQISNFVGQSNWIPDALRGPAGTAATYLGVDAPLDIINSFGDPAGMLGAGMGLLNRAGAAGQGVRNIGQKLLTDGGYATPNVVSTELREIGSRMLPPGPRGVGPQNLLPETTARTFVAPPAGVGGQPAQTLFPSHMVDPALAGEVVTSGRPQSPFAGSLTSKYTPEPGTVDPRFVDLDELREAERIRNLNYTNQNPPPGSALEVPDRGPSMPPESGDTRLGFSPQSNAELGYPLNIVPDSLRPRQAQGMMAAHTPARMADEVVDAAGNPVTFQGSRRGTNTPEEFIAGEPDPTQAIQPGEDILASAPRGFRQVPDTRMPQHPIIDMIPTHSSNAPSQFSPRYHQLNQQFIPPPGPPNIDLTPVGPGNAPSQFAPRFEAIKGQPPLILREGVNPADLVTPNAAQELKGVRGITNIDPEKFTLIARKFADVKEPGTVQKIWDLTKGLMGVDLPWITSASFRQGNMYFGTKKWWEAWGKAAKAYGSKTTAEAMEMAALQDPLFAPRWEPQFHKDGTPILDEVTGRQKLKELPSFAEQADLKVGNLNNYITRDDMTRAGYAEQIPVYGTIHVQGSNRGYNAFLNHLARTQFKEMIEGMAKLGRDPRQDMTLAKEIAKAINITVKRPRLGKLGDADLEQSIGLLNNLIWSPRNISAERQIWNETLNPRTYRNATPEVKKMLWAANLRRMGMWLGVATTASMAGAKVVTDITSSDFGKIQVGNTRIDPPGGMQQFVVLAARTLAQRSTSSTTEQTTDYMSREGYNSAADAGRFLRNRLNPTGDLLIDLGMGGSRRDPVGAIDRVLQSLVPLPATGVREAIKEDPTLLPVLMFLNSSGMGTQTYQRGDRFNAPKILPNKYDILLPSH